MAREVCEICGGTGIAVQPIAYEDAAGTVQHAVSRIACWGCDYGKRHTLSELDALNTERERGAAAMARDDGKQQAMSSERLAELEQMAFAFGDWQPTRALINGIHELLAEVERLRAREAALVALVERVATMLYIPLTNASGVTTREICGGCARTFRRDDSGWFSEDSRHAPECVVEQARALLASAETGELHEQAAQGEA